MQCGCGVHVVLLSSGGAAIAINGLTGATTTPPTLNSAGQYPQAFESGDLWGNCACGAVTTAVRSATGTGTAVDIIDTATLGAYTIASTHGRSMARGLCLVTAR